MSVLQIVILVIELIRFACLLYVLLIILPVLVRKYPEANFCGINTKHIFVSYSLLIFAMLLSDLFADDNIEKRIYFKWIFILFGLTICCYGAMFLRLAPLGIVLGIIFYGIWYILNSTVIILNNYKMPVNIGLEHPLAVDLMEKLEQYCFVDANTKLAFLGDCIPFGDRAMVNIGDILIISGPIIVAIAYVLKMRNRLV